MWEDMGSRVWSSGYRCLGPSQKRGGVFRKAQGSLERTQSWESISRVVLGEPGVWMLRVESPGLDLGLQPARFGLDILDFDFAKSWSATNSRATCTKYLDPESMYHHSPKPFKITQKAIILHTLGVQVENPK